MSNHRNKLLSILVVILIIGTISPASFPFSEITTQSFSMSDLPSDQVPLRRVAIVAPDSTSYIDEYAYMATIPTSVFYHNDIQYISPLIYGEGSQSENWLLEDWNEYLATDGGTTQAFAVGDFSESYITSIQHQLGVKVYPRITGTGAADIAAKIATSEWSSSNAAVLAVIEESFTTPSLITGSATHTFEGQASELFEFSGIANYSAPSTMNFTPPAWAGWIEGAFNWTTNDIITHQLYDPNGEIVDYSVYIQVYFSRHPAYVVTPIPLNFWLPRTVDGTWSMELTRDSALPAVHTPIDADVFYHPGHIETVTVPENARWFNY